MSQLNRDVQALLRTARGGHEPSAEQQAALLDAFALQVSGVQTARQTHLSRTKARPRAPRRVGWAVAGLMITASLGAAASFVQVLRVFGLAPSVTQETVATTDPPKSVVKSQRRGTRAGAAPVVPAPSLQIQDEAPAKTVLPTVPSSELSIAGRKDMAPVAIKRSPNGSLDAELALIARARDALKRRAFDEARAIIREHELRFSRGQLTEERQAMAALVACRSAGDTQYGEAFLQRFKNSLFAPRVRKDCEL